MMHKKFYTILIVMVGLSGLLFFIQLRRANQITVKQNQVALISQNTIFIPLSNSEIILGNPGAPITVVEFVDFSCKECLALHSEIKDVVTQHPQDMRLIWKDNPQPKILSKNMELAHQAGWCATQQDTKKFWQFVDIATQNTGNLTEQGLQKIGQGLNINMEAWWQCATGSEAKQKIAESVQLADGLGIKSLPVIFVNNKLINTDADINIKEMLESFIAK